jgi:hypothetical protein
MKNLDTKRALKGLGLLLLAGLAVGMLAALLAGAGWLGLGGGDATGTLIVNGHTIDPEQLGLGDAFGAAFGLALALLITAAVLLFVVPLAVLVPLGLVALLLAGVMIVVVGALALAFSPLILLAAAIWLLVRLARGRRTATAAGGAAGGTTITG